MCPLKAAHSLTSNHPTRRRQLLGGAQQAVQFADDLTVNDDFGQFAADLDDDGFAATDDATDAEESNQTPAGVDAGAGSDIDGEAKHPIPDAAVDVN